jgi:hypothetical protein
MRVATKSTTFLQAFTPAQTRKLMEILDGVTAGQLDAVIKSGYLAEIFDPAARLDRLIEIQKVLGITPGRKDKGVPAGIQIVDFSKTLFEMLDAANLNFGHKFIGESGFKIKGVGRIQFQQSIFTFEEDVMLEDACERIIAADSRSHWTPGKIENLLAFTSELSGEWDHRRKLVAPGSIGVNRGSRNPKGPEVVALIGKDKTLMKFIKTETIHSKLSPDNSFLAVRVSKSLNGEE